MHSLSGRCQGSDPGHLAPRGGHEQTQRRARAAAGDGCARDRHGPHTTPHRDSRAPPAGKLERHRPLRGEWKAPAVFGPWTDADLEAVHGVWPRAENLKSAQSALRWGGGLRWGGAGAFPASERELEVSNRLDGGCPVAQPGVVLAQALANRGTSGLMETIRRCERLGVTRDVLVPPVASRCHT